MEVVKITRKVYKVRFAIQRPFYNFSKFKQFRESRNLSFQKCCFNCGYKFKDEDDLYGNIKYESESEYISINENGKVVIDGDAPTGDYEVKVIASGDKNHKADEKIITITIED